MTDWKKELSSDKKPVELTELEIQELLDELKFWKLEKVSGLTRLVREVKFTDFIEAFGYISKLALIAQMMDHHAEIFNVYNKVKISLYTHDTLSITTLDAIFAHNAELLIEAK